MFLLLWPFFIFQIVMVTDILSVWLGFDGVLLGTLAGMMAIGLFLLVQAIPLSDIVYAFIASFGVVDIWGWHWYWAFLILVIPNIISLAFIAGGMGTFGILRIFKRRH